MFAMSDRLKMNYKKSPKHSMSSNGESCGGQTIGCVGVFY